MMTDQRHPNCLPIEEEERRRELHRQGLDDRTIARAVGVSYKAIMSWRYTRSLKPNRPAPQEKEPTPSVVTKCPEMNRRFIEAFERDLVTTAGKHRDWPVDIIAFINTWREVRAGEVIGEIERGAR